MNSPPASFASLDFFLDGKLQLFFGGKFFIVSIELYIPMLHMNCVFFFSVVRWWNACLSNFLQRFTKVSRQGHILQTSLGVIGGKQ